MHRLADATLPLEPPIYVSYCRSGNRIILYLIGCSIGTGTTATQPKTV
jgi:hypothetical protein